MIDPTVSAYYTGDCRKLLKQLPDGCVQTCVTSPPFWGLRDYETEGQIGLEDTPEAYVEALVAVFRQVWRVLRDDGTLWLNLGDCYAGSRSGPQGESGQMADRRVSKHRGMMSRTKGIDPKNKRKGPGSNDAPNRRRNPKLKHKDLVGIPWMAASALREPYYTGTIRDERDRIWLAAMLDAEGCLFIHKRKKGQSNGQGYVRQSDNYGPGVEISNTSLAVVERIMALVGRGSICSQGPEENSRRKQRIYRWNLRTIECRDFVREMYPYLVAKQHQARILCGCPSSGERAEAAHAALIGLHRGSATDVDFPPPEPMMEPGFYLRSDIIWAKPNPLPESVTDRCTKAHEYLFHFSKSPSYYYNGAAIAEPVVWDGQHRNIITPDQSAMPGAPPHTGLRKYKSGNKERKQRSEHGGNRDRNTNQTFGVPWENEDDLRNKRTVWEVPAAVTLEYAQEQAKLWGDLVAAWNSSGKPSVWTVTPQPYHGTHFATFPPLLIEPCILACSRPGDLVLDPFFGSGTTGEVAEKHERRWIGFDINPKYADLAKERTAQRTLPLSR